MIIIVALLFKNELVLLALKEPYITGIILCMIMAIIIYYVHKKRTSKNYKIETKSIPYFEHKKQQAKLILKQKHEFLIKEYVKTFGREDFFGVVESDDLKFIGKKHFKITLKEDGYYIEDLNTKNGTKLNGKEIKGLKMQKLENESNILVAKTLDIMFFEEII